MELETKSCFIALLCAFFGEVVTIIQTRLIFLVAFTVGALLSAWVLIYYLIKGDENAD